MGILEAFFYSAVGFAVGGLYVALLWMATFGYPRRYLRQRDKED